MTAPSTLAPRAQTARRQVSYLLAYAERYGAMPHETPEFDDDPKEPDA